MYEEKEMIVGNITISNQEKQGSLFYDSDSHQLYWSDSKRNAVLSCSVESLPCNNPVTVLRVDFHNNLGMLVFYDIHKTIIFLFLISFCH